MDMGMITFCGRGSVTKALSAVCFVCGSRTPLSFRIKSSLNVENTHHTGNIALSACKEEAALHRKFRTQQDCGLTAAGEPSGKSENRAAAPVHHGRQSC
jgi:hypothetical protein